MVPEEANTPPAPPARRLARPLALCLQPHTCDQSPALQRFKAQTDSMLADVQSFVNRSSLVSVVTDVRSSLMSWFY